MEYFILNENDTTFPDPRQCNENGLLAIGGDLSPRRLIEAYEHGIFPWPMDGFELLWWSLDPREILFPSNFRYSKSLRRVVKSGKFEVRIDTCFEEVMRCCQQTERQGEKGSWITENMIKAYCQLYKKGAAHSFETFYQGKLVGGLYGVCTRNYFCGESMFHTMTDASKVALVRLMDFATLHGFSFIDAQQPTEHLNSMGATAIPRDQFLDLLQQSRYIPRMRQHWRQHTAVLLLGGNQGDREKMLRNAIYLIALRIGLVSMRSYEYETAPWGFESSLPFLNQALIVDTNLSADEVMNEILHIEEDLGRIRSEWIQPSEHTTYQDRPIDIDMIFYDSFCSDTPTLQVPHPRMAQRRFVLQPLTELIPDFVHPVLHKTVQQLLDECPDTSDVKILYPPANPS